MIEVLRELLGSPPLGFQFLEYMFSYVLVLAGLFVIYGAVCALIDLFR